MKKLFFTLIAVIATSLASVAQTSLHDAYLSIADKPGMKAKSDKTIQVNGVADVNGARTVTAKTQNNAEKLRNEFVEVIESLPSRDIVISTTNQDHIATIFAEPSDHNMYNVLILKGDTSTGVFSATYGTSTFDDISAISAYDLQNGGHELVLLPTTSDSGAYISMTE